MKTFILLLLTSLTLTYLSPSHTASSTVRCFTPPKSVTVALKQHAAVFTGEVIATKNEGNYLGARFRVERAWKGVEAEEILVLTDSTVESPHYRVGQKYLVFAGRRDGKLFTGNCSRTKHVDYAQEDLQQLEKIKVQEKKQ